MSLPVVALAQTSDPTPDWVAAGTGAGPAAVLAVAGGDANSDGPIAAAGQFAGALVFGDLAIATEDTTADAFVVVLETDGAVRWLRHLAAPGAEAAATGVAVLRHNYQQPDDAGDVLVTGWAEGPVTLDGGAAPDQTLEHSGGADGFVARYSAAGDLLWVRRMTGPADTRPAGVAVTWTDLAVVGAFSGTVRWNDSTRVSAGGTDGFFARYAFDGALVRLDTFGGADDDEAADVSALQETFSVAGTFRATAAIGDSTFVSRGGSDAFALFYGWRGARSAVQIGGPGDDSGEGMGYNLSLVGTFVDSLTLGTQTIVSNGPSDVFVALLGGHPLRVYDVYQAGGPGADVATDVATMTVLREDVPIYLPLVVGVSAGDVTFPAAWPSEPVHRIGRGGTDGFAFSLEFEYTYAASLVGDGGNDRALAAGTACGYEGAWCETGLIGGVFQGSGRFGTATIPGTAPGDDDAFVAFYAKPAFVPFYVASAPGPETEARLAVGPNPSHGSAAAVLTLAAPAAVTVAVYDALGRRVATLHGGSLVAGPSQWPLPAGLAPGVYVVRVDGDVRASAQVVVTR